MRALPDPDHMAVLARPGFLRASVHSHAYPGDDAVLSLNQAAATSWKRCPFTTARF